MSSDNYRRDTLHISFPKNNTMTTSEFIKFISKITDDLENGYDIININNNYANIKFNCEDDAYKFKNEFYDLDEERIFLIDFFKEKNKNIKIHVSRIPSDITVNKFMSIIDDSFDITNINYQFNSDLKSATFSFNSFEKANEFKSILIDKLKSIPECIDIRVNYYKYKKMDRYNPYRNNRNNRGNMNNRRGGNRIEYNNRSYRQ